MYTQVHLMLGAGCNFNCRYCLQHTLVTKPLPANVSPELITFLRNMPVNEGQKINFTFYGGEPLLYWAAIEEVTKAIEDTGKYGLSVITNGKLLTDAMVDFMNEHKIVLVISHDGPNCAEFRDEDVFANPVILERFRRHYQTTIDCVFSARNYDVQAILAYFSTLGIDSDRVQFEMIMDTGLPRELVDFDWDKYQTTMDGMEERLYQALIHGETTPELGIANPVISRLRYVVREDAEADTLEKQKCGVGWASLNVDLQGNCYICHNSSIKVGTIQDPYETLMERINAYNVFVRAEKCQTCPVLPTCGGGCMLVDAEARERYYCQMNKTFFGATQNAVVRAGNYCKGHPKSKEVPLVLSATETGTNYLTQG